MDYRNILITHLLSNQNIDNIVNIIINNYKISQKAIPKCINIISNYFNKYVDNLERYPVNDIELYDAINFLNKKCYDDFVIYLSNKYPNMNLLRQNIDKNNIQINNSQDDEIIILNEEEKNKLLEKYGLIKNVSNDFSYLTNPIILQMLQLIINQNNHPKKEDYIVIDSILDAEEAEKLLKSYNMLDKIKITHDEKIEEIKEDEIKLDIKLTKDSLPLADKKIKQLLAKKEKYLNDSKMIQEIDEEIQKVITSVKELKNELEKEAHENEDKMKGMKMNVSKENNDDNIEYLDLEFDPMNDPNDLKNIIIKFKVDRKIVDITLINYYLPFNRNNVTRLNNKFVIYFNNKVHKINIVPGNYEINTLLDYIKNQLTFLDFNISENKLITIKNTMNMPFDMLIENDSIFPILGFVEKNDLYKEKIFYSASKAYNMDCNKEVYFLLSGTSMEPLLMEFDKKITLNKSLKKSHSGVIIKQLVLRFTNSIEQYYDFISTFNMCLKITYLK